jgi:hypothetical protein
MAEKARETSKTGGAAASSKAARKVVAKQAASPRKAADAKAGAAKTADVKTPVAAATSPKVGTPKAAMPTGPATAARKGASKGAAPIKLTDRQREFLKTISAAKEQGYTTAKKGEQKTIDALLDRKLIKRGAKDKASGNYCYMVSKAGEKHLA